MARRHGRGKWPLNCEECGCPGVFTKNDDNPEHERMVWAYEVVDRYLEKIRVLEAIIADGVRHEELERLRDLHDPTYGFVEDILADWKEEE